MKIQPLLGLFLFPVLLTATSINWNDSAANSAWHLNTNWVGNVTPGNNDSIIFSGAPGASMPLLDDIAGLSLVSISNGVNFTQQLNQSLTLTGAGFNDGTIQFGSGSPMLTISGTGTLTSDGILTGTGGTLAVAGGLNLTGGSLTGGALTGAGSVSASGAVNVSGITNSTTFTTTAGTTTLQGIISNSGTFANTGGSLDLADALGLSGGGSVTGNATNLGTSSLSNITYSNGILGNSSATINVGSQNLTVEGSGGHSGEITGGTIATSLAGMVEALGNAILDTTHAGTYNLVAGDGGTGTNLTVQGDSKFDIQSGNSVEITNNATLSLSENLQNDGGTFKVDVGGEVDPANFVQNTGSTGIDGSATFNSVNIDGGTLELSGSISGDVTLSGAGASATIDPGGNGVVGIATDTGGFSATNGAAETLTIDVDGSHAGQYDVWNISSIALIDGTLNLDFGGGYVPQAGDAYTILTSGFLNGTFSTVNLVNAFGATASVNEVNNDVVVDILTSGVTPEPAVWSLVGLGLAGLWLSRRLALRQG